MPVYDGDLKELQRRAARRAQVQAQLRELETQRSALEARVEELAVVLHDERADVERLEAGGLTAFFYSLLGKGEEKLDKERREAAAAALKYESAARELAEAAVEACGDGKAVLLANHGLVAWEGSLPKAFSLARDLEFTAELQWRAMAVGTPNILTDSQMAEALERFKTYGQPKK